MARKVMNGLDLQNQKIVNLADPSSSTDAATKQYVDNVGAGKSWKEPARAATTANGTLASAYENGDSIDGVTLATGDRILIKNQSSGAENGIYTVNATGAPTRATDADSAGELKAGTTVYVAEGTVNGDKEFSLTTDGTITIGTTATTWGQTGGSGTTYSAGNGLALASTTFSVLLDSNSGMSVSGTGLKIDTAVVARKYSANIGNGSSTSIAVNHALGTRDVTVSVHDASTFEEVEVDVVKTDTANVTVTFATAPASNAYRVTVIG
jgi:hypothetical protein